MGLPIASGGSVPCDCLRLRAGFHAPPSESFFESPACRTPFSPEEYGVCYESYSGSLLLRATPGQQHSVRSYSSDSDEIIHRYSTMLIAAMQATPSTNRRKRLSFTGRYLAGRRPGSERRGCGPLQVRHA